LKLRNGKVRRIPYRIAKRGGDGFHSHSIKLGIAETYETQGDSRWEKKAWVGTFNSG